MRALDDAGIAGLPTVQPFTVKTRPVAPLYQHPAPGAVVPSGAAELRCTEVPGVRWYRVQVAADAQFTQPLRDEGQDAGEHLIEARAPVAGAARAFLAPVPRLGQRDPGGERHWPRAAAEQD